MGFWGGWVGDSVTFYSSACVVVFTSGNQSLDITFQDIKEGTRDFHHELRIADGHFSDIYKAQIRNQTFAVKLFKQVITDSSACLHWKPGCKNVGDEILIVLNLKTTHYYCPDR